MAAPPIRAGFRFNPTPREAVADLLPRLIAGAPMHPSLRPIIHAADIYACEPGVLARRFRPALKTGDRFFFTACKRQPGRSSRAVRAAGPGSWHSQGHSTAVFDRAGAVKVGELRKLRYKKGATSTDWLMDEFSCCCVEGAVIGDTERVLCKIYVSPRARPNSAARQESAAIFALPAPEEPVAAVKRPAPPVAEPTCPKRAQHEDVPTPPVVQPLPFSPPPPCVPRHGMAPAPSATQLPASALALAIVPTRPVVPAACHMPVQAPATRRCPPQPSVQTYTVAHAAASSPVLARDPFCSESIATAQDDDDGDEFAKLLEESLDTDEAACDVIAPEAAQDDDDDFAKFLEDTLVTDEAEEESNPFAAAIAREAKLMMCA